MTYEMISTVFYNLVKEILKKLYYYKNKAESKYNIGKKINRFDNASSYTIIEKTLKGLIALTELMELLKFKTYIKVYKNKLQECKSLLAFYCKKNWRIVGGEAFPTNYCKLH